MIGGLLSYGIGQIDTFPVWKAVFLTCGGVTVLWAIVLFLFLPDSIMSAKNFTLEEKALLIGRAKLAQTGVLNKSIKWYQIKEAFLDPQVWLLTLFMLLNEIINGGIANFGKLIIKGLVSDPLLTTALGIPQGAFQVFWILSGTFLASKLPNSRTLVMALYLVPTVIGTTLMWKLDREHHKIGVLFGYYIVGAFVASLVLALQMPATNLGGYTKRITASAIVFTAYCVGNIIGPHAFLAKEAPLYQTGCIVILACSATQMVVAIVLRMLLIARNKRRDEAAAAIGDADISSPDEAIDRTDFEVSLHALIRRSKANTFTEPPLPIRFVGGCVVIVLCFVIEGELGRVLYAYLKDIWGVSLAAPNMPIRPRSRRKITQFFELVPTCVPSHFPQ